MTTLWLISASMCALALVFVVPPLLRRADESTPDESELNIELHRERLRELEQDLAAGTIEQSRFDEARAEIENALLDDLGNEQKEDSFRPRSILTAAILSVAVPALAISFYWKQGSWKTPAQAPQATAPQPADGDGPKAPLPDIAAMLPKLEDRLKTHPDDGEGWLMLGHSYTFLQRFSDAAGAYKKADELAGHKDPNIMLAYAEALALAAESKLDGEPEQLIKRALQLDPNNEKALWLNGLAAFQREDFAAAVIPWEKLASVTPVGSEEEKLLSGFLAEARQRAGLSPVATATTAAQPDRKSQPSAATLQVNVSLDPGLADAAKPGDTVFIFARAASGPKMPLAIARKRVADLPTTVTLSDAMAMAPSMRLSMFAQVVVGARISKTGNAIASSGDLQGISSPITLADTPSVRISINEQVN